METFYKKMILLKRLKIPSMVFLTFLFLALGTSVMGQAPTYTPSGSVCYGLPFTLHAQSQPGWTAPYTGQTYAWSAVDNVFGSTESDPIVYPTNASYVNQKFTLVIRYYDPGASLWRQSTGQVVVNTLRIQIVLGFTPANITCNGGTNGSVSLAVTNNGSPYTYLWSNGKTTANITGLSAATYTVTVTNKFNCSQTGTTSVTEPAVVGATTSQTNVSCYGLSNGSVTLTGSGGNSGYQYKLSPGSFSTNGTFSSLAAGTYTFNIQDVNSCAGSKTVVITQPLAPLAAGTSQTNIKCKNNSTGAISLSVSNGTSPYTYSWSGSGVVVTAQNQTGLAAGAYHVTVTDIGGCSATASATLTEPLAVLAASTTTGVVSCKTGSNGTVTLGVSGGTSPYTYLWTGSGVAPTAQNQTGLAAGTYHVTVTDNNNCTVSTSDVVSEPATALSASAAEGQPVSCFNGSNGTATVSASNGWGGYTYLWNNTQTGATATSLTAGTYTVTVTDLHGCSVTATAAVSGPGSALAASATGSNLVCYDGDASATVYPSNGWGSYSYLWNNAQTGATATALSAGTYTVTVTDLHGCTVTATAQVNRPAAALAASAAGTKVVTCFGGSDGAATVYPSDGWGSYTYLWNNTATGAVASGLSAGTYMVTVTDGNGCSVTASASVSGPGSALAASAAGTKVVTCFGGVDGAATVYPSNGWGSYSYLWNNGHTTAIAGGLSAGTYTVTVSDGNGCTATATASVSGPAASLAASAAGTKVVTCFGGSDGTATVYPSNGWGSFTYLWNNTATGAVASGLSAGIYTVTVSDGNGCTTTATASVSGPSAALAATAAETKVVTCFGGSDGTATVYPSNGWGTFTYLWNNTQTGAIATGLSAGTYTVTVSDGIGCTATASAVVSGPLASLAASAAGTKVVTCFGGSDGTATASASSGWGTYSYLWNNSQTGAAATGLAEGNYTVTVSDGNGCSVTATAHVSGPTAALAATAAETKVVSCFGGSDGEATVSPVNGWGGYTYLWNNSQTGVTATGLSSGIYTVTVTDLNSCSVTATAGVSQPAFALAATAAGTTVVTCFGGTNGAATVYPSNGWGSFSYAWNNGQTVAVATALSAGNYTVTVTDGHGCSVTATATVAGPSAALAASAAETKPETCFGDADGTATVYASFGWASYTYNWNNSQTGATATGLIAGNYTVTVTDGNGCKVTASAAVSGPSASLASSYSQTNVLNCYNDATGAIDLSVSGGSLPYTYFWTGTGVAATAEDQSGLKAGTYNVTVTDAHNCKSTQSVTLTQPDQLTSNVIISDVLCNGNPTGAVDPQIGGGTPGYNYTWDDFNLSSDAILTGVTAGTYHLTVTDNNSCTLLVGPITITEPELFDALNTAHNVSCKGASDGHIDQNYISGGVSPYYYMWSNGETTTGISGLTAGTYYLTVSDSHSCTIPGGIWVQEPDFDLTAAAAESKPVTCFHGDDGQATVTPDGGWGSYTFLWNNGQTSFTATGLTAGTYSVTVSDGGGCSFSTSTVVNEPGAALAASAAETKPVTCFGGSDGTAAVYASDGWGSYTYLWNNSQTGATASGLSAGIYSVTVSDLNGCSVTANATVTGPSGTLAATAAETKVVTCFGGADGTATVYPSLGWGSYSYTWNNTQTGATASGLSAGTYTVTVADFNGCTVTATATVTGPSGTLAASAAETKVVTCFGGSDGTATVYPSSGWGGFTYLWNNTQTGATASGLSAGTYTVTVSDLHGCTTTASATVTGPAASLAASAAETKVVTCFGGSDGEATVYASDGWGSYTYLWNNTQTGATATGLSAGTYTVTVSDGNNCSVTATATVTGPIAALDATAAGTKVVTCFGGTDGEATAYPSFGWGGYTYLWNNTQTGSTATGLSAGTYSVTVTDMNNCTTVATASVSGPSGSLAASAAGTKVVSCFGGTDGEATVYPSSGWGSYSYLWNNTQTGLTATGLSAGDYTVTITDGHSCAVTAAATVSGPAASLEANAAGTKVVSCFNGADGHATVYASFGWGGYTYLWNNAQTNATATALSAGTYTVTVSDLNGCTVTATASVIGPAAWIDASATETKVVTCFGGSDGEATVYPSFGWGTYTYLWNNTQTGATATGLSAGNYSVTVTDFYDCKTIATASVSQPAFALAATAAGSKVVTCFGGTDGEATVTPTNGWGGYTYLWNNTQTGAIATSLSAGNYTVTVSDLNGCHVTATATVYGPSAALAASAAETKPVSCFGESNGAATVYPNNGWGSYSFTWNNSQTGATATGLSVGTYTVTVLDGNGCTTTATAYVSQPDAALTSSYLKTDVLGCHGDLTGAIDLTVTGGTSPYYFVWTGAGVDATAEDQTGLAAGTYNVTITDARSCTTSTSAVISQPDQLTANPIVTDVLCNGNPTGAVDPQIAGGTLNYNYSWDDFNLSSDAILTGVTAGTYHLTVTDNNSCVLLVGPVTITEPPLFDALNTAHPVTCKGASDGHIDQNYISGGVSPYFYMWSNGETTPGISGLTAGTYYLTVSDSHSCTIPGGIWVQEPDFALGASAIQSKPVTCFGGSDGTATVTATGGWETYTYLWNNTQTGATATGLSAGNYSVTVNDGGGCSVVATATVYGPGAAIEATAAETKVVTCFGGSDGTATVYPSFGWGTYSYMWNNTQTDATATGLSAGIYTVTVSDGNGCSVTANATVTQPTSALAASAAGTKVVTCFGGTDGEATVYPSFGWGSYTYLWNNGQTDVTATGLSAGNYTVTVSDGHNCSVTADASVAGPGATLAASAAETKVVSCFGGSDGTATVYPSFGWGSYTFVWNNTQTGATATGLSAGTYTVTVYDGYNCSVTASATVTEPGAALAATAAETKVVTCFGGSDGTATAYPVDGWGSYSYLWNNTQTGATATGLSAGTYTVTVSDVHNCAVTATATVTGPSGLLGVLAFQSKPVTCFGGSDGEATAYPTFGWGSYSYSWDNSQTSATASGLSAGTYTVTVTDGHGCTATANATVYQPDAALAASAAGTKVVTCFGGTDGEATVYPSFGWGSYTYLWNNSQTGVTATGLSAGSYTVTVYDGNGCNITASAVVSGPSATLAASAAGTKVVTCFGGSDGAATVYPSFGWGSYSYLWNNNQTAAIATSLTAGTYYVTVTDGHSCTTTTFATVLGPGATLAASATQTKPVSCVEGLDGEATVYPSFGWSSYTYMWNNGQTVATATGLSAGTYTVTVSDGIGCTTTATAVVNEPAFALGASATGTKVVTCYGNSNGEATVTPTNGWGGYTYLWNNAQTGAIATSLSAGNYTVTVSDLNGCHVTATATVYGPSAALAASAAETKPVSCFGESNGAATVYPNNGWGSYSFTWNNSQTGATATGLSVGTYTVTVLDGNGCTTTATAYVSQPDAALTSSYLKTDVLGCHGDLTGAIDLTVTGGTSPYYFVWTGAGVDATAEDQTGLAAGTYNVTITDARSCTTSTSAVISQPDQLTANPIVTDVLCNGNPTGAVDPQIAGGTLNYNYSWDDFNLSSDAILTGVTAGTYHLTVTDNNSCVLLVGPVTITEPPLFDALNTAHPVTCKGASDGHIDQNYISGGVSPYFYMWSNGETTPGISGLTAGTYYLTVSDSHSCTIPGGIWVQEPDFALGASAIQSKPVTCFGGSDGTATVTATGGWETYTYLWNNTQTGATATGLSAGNYSVTVNDGGGCSVVATATVYGPGAAIAASAAETKVVSCFGGSDGEATVYPSFGWGTYSYLWNNTQTGATATGLTAGTYTVTVSDFNGCTATATATVTEPTFALAATAAETKVVTCFGGSDGTATVYPSFGWGSYTYLWNNGQSTAIASSLTAGIYTVTVSDLHGCSVTAGATVTGPSASLAATAAETHAVTCFGGSDGTATAYPSFGWGSYTYIWNNTQTGAIATGLTHGTYTVTVSDGHGCSTTATAAVTEPTQLTVSTSVTNVNCHGETNGTITVNAGGGSPAYQYSKDGGTTYQSSSMFSGLAAGTYQVWVKDSHSCTANTAQVVTEPTQLTLSGVVVSNTCFSYSNGSVTLSVSGGTPSYNYAWSNGASVNPITNLTAGTYTVTVSDAHVCSISSSYVVTQPAAWAISITGHDTACCNTGLGNNNTTYTAPAPTGTYFSPVTYQWVVEGGTIVSGQNTNTIVISWSCCGSGKVYLTVTDAHTCALTTVKNVTILPPPAPVIAGPVSVPADTTGVVYTTPFVTGHLYTWSIIGGSIVSGQGTNTIHVNWGPFPACGCGQVSVCESSPAGCLGCNTMNITIIPSVNYQLAGYVKYYNPYQTALNGVTVKLRNTITNTIAATTVTGPNMTSAGEPGYFSFAGIPAGTYYKLEATFNGTWGGNNATDALMVQLEAANPGTILTPTNGLTWMAGDVNASTTITALDALYIKLRVVGSITSYPAGNWKFDNPAITIPTVSLMTVNGLCVGDVNGSYIPVGMKEASFMSVTDDRIQTVVAGHTFSYEIRSNSAAELGAMTLFMGYDNSRFDVVDVTTSLNDGMKYVIENGNVAIAWSDPKSLTVKNDEPLFTLTVKAKAQLAEPTQIFSVRTGSEFADPKGNRYDDFSLKMGKVITPSATEFSMSNFPNPFANHTSIVYSMPESGKVKLVLTNLFGQTIRTLVDEAQAAGIYSVDVNPIEFNLTPGVYLYKIEVTGATDTYVKSNKMIFAK